MMKKKVKATVLYSDDIAVAHIPDGSVGRYIDSLITEIRKLGRRRDRARVVVLQL